MRGSYRRAGVCDLKKVKMAVTIHDNWNGESGMFADQMHESDKPTHSQLLGPDGKRLAYETQRLGFDLRPQAARDKA